MNIIPYYTVPRVQITIEFKQRLIPSSPTPPQISAVSENTGDIIKPYLLATQVLPSSRRVRKRSLFLLLFIMVVQRWRMEKLFWSIRVIKYRTVYSVCNVNVSRLGLDLDTI